MTTGRGNKDVQEDQDDGAARKNGETDRMTARQMDRMTAEAAGIDCDGIDGRAGHGVRAHGVVGSGMDGRDRFAP